MKRAIQVVVVLVLVVGGYFGYIHGRFFMYQMKTREWLDDDKAWRFPSVEAITTLPDKLKAKATESKLPAETFSVTDMWIEPRAMGPATFWYFGFTVHDASRTFKYERRFENPATFFTDNAETFEKAGIKLKKP